MKIKPKPCGARGCTNTHKSPSGFCSQHGHLIDSATARPPGESAAMFGQSDKFRRKPKHGLGG